MRPKAYSYIRFSSPEQAKGDSERRQIEASETYAREHGLELVRDSDYAFLDRGRSAFQGRNAVDGELGRFLKLVESGAIQPGSYLLVESLDRLSRETATKALARFIDLLNAGIRVVTLVDKREFNERSGPAEIMYSLMSISRAHEESFVKGKRVRAAWAKKKLLAAEEKKPIGAAHPLWLKLVEGKYVLDQERAEVVRKIFDYSISGYGRGAIAKKLNEQHIKPFKFGISSDSGVWGPSSVAKVLENRAVLGEYQPYTRNYSEEKGRYIKTKDGNPIPDYYPRIIDDETFYRSGSAVSERKNSWQTKAGSNFSNLYTGIAYCGECGSTMRYVNKGKPPKGYNYLVCSKALVGACKYHGFRYEHAEAAFVEALTMLPTLSLVQEAPGKIENDIAKLRAVLDEKRERAETLSEILVKQPSDFAAKALRGLEDEIGSDEAELAALERRRVEEDGIIRDRELFIENLSLKTYEERYRANKLLHRLDIHFFFQRNSEPLESEYADELSRMKAMDPNFDMSLDEFSKAYILERYYAVQKGEILFKVHRTGSGLRTAPDSEFAFVSKLVQGDFSTPFEVYRDAAWVALKILGLEPQDFQRQEVFAEVKRLIAVAKKALAASKQS